MRLYLLEELNFVVSRTWMAKYVGRLPQRRLQNMAGMSATVSRKIVSSAESIWKRITNSIIVQPHGNARAVECPCAWRRVPMIRKGNKVAVMSTGCRWNSISAAVAGLRKQRNFHRTSTSIYILDCSDACSTSVFIHFNIQYIIIAVVAFTHWESYGAVPVGT